MILVRKPTDNLSRFALNLLKLKVLHRGFCELKINSSMPKGILYENCPKTEIDADSFFECKRIVLIGVPGAFSPGCSLSHVPGYIEFAHDFKQRGIDDIAVISVNDPFVMKAWGQSLAATGKVRFFADSTGKYTKKMGMDFESEAFGGIRSKRYSMLIHSGFIQNLNVEPDNIGLSVSLVENFKLCA